MYTWINYQELYCTRKLTDAIDFITTSIRKGVGPKAYPSLLFMFC